MIVTNKEAASSAAKRIERMISEGSRTSYELLAGLIESSLYADLRIILSSLTNAEMRIR